MLTRDDLRSEVEAIDAKLAEVDQIIAELDTAERDAFLKFDEIKTRCAALRSEALHKRNLLRSARAMYAGVT